jgi:cyclopropane fatty-acyl-phospholipid synthase-like methyltransferase
MAAQFHFNPDIYAKQMADGVPAYARLQVALAEAAGAHAGAGGQPAERLLELGTGTGETAVHVLAAHPGATLIGIDASDAMLAHARPRLPEADLRVARLEDPLPSGPFDIVFSALAVHHLDGPGKADLFARVAAVLAPGGRFVLGDLIVPEHPADVVTPVDDSIDRPSTIEEQLTWLADAGLAPALTWRERDLAVLVGVRAI